MIANLTKPRFRRELNYVDVADPTVVFVDVLGRDNQWRSNYGLISKIRCHTPFNANQSAIAVQSIGASISADFNLRGRSARRPQLWGAISMNFEPNKFFIGLTDFFSTLLPGIALSSIAWVALNDDDLSALKQLYDWQNNSNWLLLLFASYVLGHFCFAVGAVLDDLVYDPLRSCTDGGQIARLADGKGLTCQPLRGAILWSNFFKNGDEAVQAAGVLKHRALEAAGISGSSVNTFQWCKARLAKDHPTGFSAIQRLEADSKFFRGFFIVLVIASLYLAYLGSWWWSASILAALLSLMRYIEQRFKTTQNAYWSVIALDSEKAATMSAKSEVPQRLSHAAGVVFKRETNGAVHFLLTTPRAHEFSTGMQEWVLPKGHIEPFEKAKNAAIREVREETKYWARYVAMLEPKAIELDGKPTMVACYLLERIEPGWFSTTLNNIACFLCGKRPPSSDSNTSASLEDFGKRRCGCWPRLFSCLCEEYEPSKGREGRMLAWHPAEEATDIATHRETKDWLEQAKKKLNPSS